HQALPDAWIEDPLESGGVPWSLGLRSRLSLDAPVTRAELIASSDPPPAAVNVKPARMGGVLEAVAAIEVCAAAGTACYLGGMLEVGGGRRQLRTLAALFTPDGPNDIAPIALAGAPAPRPARLLASDRGFGFAGEDPVLDPAAR